MSICTIGVGVETLNLENCSLEEVNESISKSAGFVIGSPTLGGHMPTQVSFPKNRSPGCHLSPARVTKAFWQKVIARWQYQFTLKLFILPLIAYWNETRSNHALELF